MPVAFPLLLQRQLRIGGHSIHRLVRRGSPPRRRGRTATDQEFACLNDLIHRSVPICADDDIFRWIYQQAFRTRKRLVSFSPYGVDCHGAENAKSSWVIARMPRASLRRFQRRFWKHFVCFDYPDKVRYAILCGVALFAAWRQRRSWYFASKPCPRSPAGFFVCAAAVK